MAKSEIIFWRKIPGFRSQTGWKMVVAVLGYGFLGLVVLGVRLTPTTETETESAPQVETAPTPTSPESQTETMVAGETANVTRVIDGDTIEIEGGKKVRYIGIDTPEISGGQEQCFGREAWNKNRELVENQTVRLEKDVSETDRYGRLLRYVYLGETMINETLVRQGFAHVSTFPPDVKYVDLFLAAQAEARDQKRGLWTQCQ